jgi:hypothetical protein
LRNLHIYSLPSTYTSIANPRTSDSTGSPKMNLRQLSRLDLPATADMHVHLRQDRLMELVVPYIRHGGVDTVFVMVRSWHRLLPCYHTSSSATG